MRVFVVALSLLVCAATPQPVACQTGDAKQPDWKALGQPGDNHRIFDPIIGKWRYQVKWWPDPSGQPQIQNGTTENKWILGKRFVQNTARGEAKSNQFEGMGTIGYDKIAGEYVSTWLDNMSTGILYARGRYDPATKMLTERGQMRDPMKGGEPVPFRGVWSFLEKGQYTYTMYTPSAEGKEVKSMEILYLRIN